MADYWNTFTKEIDMVDRALVIAYPADPGDDYVADDGGNVYAIGGDHDNSYAITAYWQSKKLDFSDQYPELKDHWKTIDKIEIRYKDQFANTPVTVYISPDGINWAFKTRLLGTGSRTIKTALFYFRDSELSTGRFFYVKFESSSASTDFEWHGSKIYFEPRGQYFEIT